MSASRRALLFILSATVAATIGVASAKGGGKGGKHFDSAWSSVTSRPVVSGTSPVQSKAFKSFKVKACNRDYKWLCPTKPIGKVQKNGP